MATDFLEAFIAHKNGWEKVIMHSHSTQGTRGRAGKYIHYICRPLNSHFSTHKFACSIDAGIWLYGKGNRKNITIVKNGIDVNKYLFDKKIRINLRKDLKLKDSFTIGHIGRFSDVKNHEFLIEIFKNINNRIPKTKLILVGDGELKPKIEEKVFALGLNNNVIFTGIRDDIEKILQALDLFILPSKYEGMPGVAIEAQASGLNCIISDTVTKDVSVTSLVEFKSIKESSELWANYIIEKYIPNNHELNRQSPINNIINAGYDISERARMFEHIYLD
jgi:glycosyltransferase involved in cell wall biosynthesis